MYFEYLKLLFIIQLTHVVWSIQTDQCQNLSPSQVKILEDTSKPLKVWLGSEVSVSCCTKMGAKNDYFETDFDSNTASGDIAWMGPNNLKIANYFTDPTKAESDGIFYIPDMTQIDKNVLIIHLLVKNFTKHNDGSYKCDYRGLNRRDANKIELIGYPKVIIDSEEVQFLEEGKPGRIICEPRGHSQIEVVWFYEQEHLSPGDNNQFSFLKNHRVLETSKATEQMSGLYLCKAEVTMEDSQKSQHGSYVEMQPIRVIVYQKPILSKESPIVKSFATNVLHVAAVEGGSLQLACDSMGLPPPQVTWYRNGKKLVPKTGDDNRIEVKESYYRRHAYSNLIIQPIQIQDVGIYSCNSTVQYGTVFSESTAKNITPEFAFQPRFISYYTKLNVTTMTGRNIAINCSVYGAYAQRLSLAFVKEGYDKTIRIFNTSVEQSRFKMTINQDSDNPYITHMVLHIYDVKSTDAGWYYCRANLVTLPTLSYSRLGIVSVLFRPEMLTNDTDKYGLWYKKNTIKCKVRGYPNAVWEWKFRDTPLTNKLDQYQIEETRNNDTSTTKLKILPSYVKEAVFGTYTCTAVNKLGQASATIVLHQASRPKPPKIDICKVTASSIQLCVAPDQETGGLPLTHYELRMQEFGQKKFFGPYYYPVKPSTITLSHLKASTGYRLAICSASEAGRGPSSYAETKTKKISAPIIQLVNTSQAPDWNAFNLRWKVESDGGLPIVQYDVDIQPVKIGSEGNVVEKVGPKKSYVIDDISQMKQVFRVNSLSPHTWYELRFQARNLMGPSILQEVVFRTLDLPESLARTGRLRAYYKGAPVNCCLSRTLLLLLSFSVVVIVILV